MTSPSRGGVAKRSERLVAALLRPVLRSVVHRSLLQQPGPTYDDRATAAGPYPIRVLMLGAGLAIGYGSGVGDPSLSERVARALADELRRGVIVESRLRASMPLERTIELIGWGGAAGFDVVVWTPALEEAFRGGSRRWERHLRLLVERIRVTGSRQVRIILLGATRTEGTHLLQRLATSLIDDVNTRIAEVAARYDRVDHVPVPAPVVDSRDRPLFDPDHQQRVVQLLAELVGTLQQTPAAASEVHHPRIGDRGRRPKSRDGDLFRTSSHEPG